MLQGRGVRMDQRGNFACFVSGSWGVVRAGRRKCCPLHGHKVALGVDGIFGQRWCKWELVEAGAGVKGTAEFVLFVGG